MLLLIVLVGVVVAAIVVLTHASVTVKFLVPLPCRLDSASSLLVAIMQTLTRIPAELCREVFSLLDVLSKLMLLTTSRNSAGCWSGALAQAQRIRIAYESIFWGISPLADQSCFLPGMRHSVTMFLEMARPSESFHSFLPDMLESLNLGHEMERNAFACHSYPAGICVNCLFERTLRNRNLLDEDFSRAVEVLSRCNLVVFWFFGLDHPVLVMFFSSPEGIHGCAWAVDVRHRSTSLTHDNMSVESDSDVTVAWDGLTDLDYSSSD